MKANTFRKQPEVPINQPVPTPFPSAFAQCTPQDVSAHLLPPPLKSSIGTDRRQRQ